MRAENFDIDQLTDYLVGTTNSLDSGLEHCFPDMEFEDLTSQELEVIDSRIFWCAECGWCCSVDDKSEYDENGVDEYCLDCKPTEE